MFIRLLLWLLHAARAKPAKPAGLVSYGDDDDDGDGDGDGAAMETDGPSAAAASLAVHSPATPLDA